MASSLPQYGLMSTREGSQIVAQVLNVGTKRVRWEGPATESELKAYEGLLRKLSLLRKTID